MSSQSELIPIRLVPARARAWGPRLFKFAYLCAIAVAMIGWSIALGWGSLSTSPGYFCSPNKSVRAGCGLFRRTSLRSASCVTGNNVSYGGSAGQIIKVNLTNLLSIY